MVYSYSLWPGAGHLALCIAGIYSASAVSVLRGTEARAPNATVAVLAAGNTSRTAAAANLSVVNNGSNEAFTEGTAFELVDSGDGASVARRTYVPRPASAAAAAMAAGENTTVFTGSSSDEEVQVEQGRVFFLFMTVSGVERPELWDEFFLASAANSGLYRAYMHCVWSTVCEMHRGRLPQLTIVPTVKSVYCDDLVSPMVQLLSSAIKDSYHPADKFVFLSESTLPAKPLQEIHARLTSEKGSDFCIEPSTSWLSLKYHGVQPATLVKHGQWVVLSQGHARLLLQRWPQIRKKQEGGGWAVPLPGNVMGQPLTTTAGLNASASFGALPNNIRICTDEWIIFAALFGAVMRKGQTTETLPSLANPMLFLEGPEAMRPQGVCHTFVFWEKDRPETKATVTELLADRRDGKPLTRLSCYPSCTTTHPGEFQALSDAGAGVLRRSPFLFVRKFAQGVMSSRQFKDIILAPVPPQTF